MQVGRDNEDENLRTYLVYHFIFNAKHGSLRMRSFDNFIAITRQMRCWPAEEWKLRQICYPSHYKMWISVCTDNMSADYRRMQNSQKKQFVCSRKRIPVMEKGVDANLNQVLHFELNLSDLITHLKSSEDGTLRQYLEDMVDKCFDENLSSIWCHA